MEEPIELVDVVDENGLPTGESLTREEAINLGKLTKTIQTWIFNNQGQVLMQIRSANNSRDAGMLDICSGQVQSGETDFHAAAREIVEEFGKRAITKKELSEIKKIGITRMDFRKYGMKGNYFVIWNALELGRQIPDSDFDLQEEEVQNIQWIDYEEIKEYIRSGKNNIRIPYVEQTEEMLRKLDTFVYKKERDTGDR